MRMALGGTGKQLIHITKAVLSKGYYLTIICPDPALCDFLAREFRADIVRGDPTEEAVLKNAGLEDCQVLVAALAEDADNYTFCQLAIHRFNVLRTIALVHHSANEELFQRMGIGGTLSLTKMISMLVEEILHKDVTNLQSLENGNVLSMVITATRNTPYLGKKQEELPNNSHSRVGLILREGRFLEAEQVLQEHDKLIVYTTPLAQGRVIQEYLGEK